MRVEFEVNDSGEIVGTPTTEQETFIKRQFDRGHIAGFGTGKAEAARDAKAQIERTIAEEKARLERELPYDRERLTKLADTEKVLRSQITNDTVEHERMLRERETEHLRKAAEHQARLDAREARIKQLTVGQVKAIAAQVGAREESLEELEIIFERFIGYDDQMQAFVKGPDGTQLKTASGQNVSLESYVKQYLDTHPAHKKPAFQKGGQARGGQTVTHGMPLTGDLEADAALKRLDEGDRSPQAINDAFNALRRKRAAG